MAKMNSKKRFLIILVAITMFVVSFQFYNQISYFLAVPITKAMSSGIDVPIGTTRMLGEDFRIFFKIALFMSLISVILFMNKKIIISFLSGVFAAYLFVRFFAIKWLVLFGIWNDEVIFSMENYMNYFILFMISIGAIFAGVTYKKMGAK